MLERAGMAITIRISTDDEIIQPSNWRNMGHQHGRDIIIKRLSNDQEFASIKAQWDRLLSASALQSAFLSWEWLYAWWKVNSSGKQLWLVTAWRGDELAGVAPLMLEKRNGFLKVLANLGTPQSDVSGFLHYPDDHNVVESLIENLAAGRNEWHILELNELEKSWLDRQGIADKFRMAGFTLTEDSNDHYYIQLENNWEKFSTKLARKFRYNLRRALRLAEEMGAVELRQFSGGRLTQEVLDSIVEINQHSNYPRLYNSQCEQALIRGLIENMASSRYRFTAYILSVDNKSVAYEYGFEHQGRFEDWRSGFDKRFPPQISVGKLLAMKVVQECISRSITEIDFLRGDEAYKLEWEPSARVFSRMRVFNNSIPSFAARFWLQKLKPIIKGGSE